MTETPRGPRPSGVEVDLMPGWERALTDIDAAALERTSCLPPTVVRRLVIAGYVKIPTFGDKASDLDASSFPTLFVRKNCQGA